MSKYLRYFVVALVATGLAFGSCRNRSGQTDEYDSRINEYVAGFTTGVVDRSDNIIIKFTRPAVEQSEQGTAADSRIFSITPSVEGSAIWSDNSTLVFTPATELAWDREYTVKVNLEELFGHDVAVKSFAFRVQTVAKNFIPEVLGLSVAEEGEGDYFIEGSILTSGRFEEEEAEAIISANQEGRQLNIEWQHDESNYHLFFVKGISRGENASEVEISWNGRKAGVDNNGSKKVTVPSRKEFKITSWRVVSSPSQYLAIEFSDELKSGLELNGMVSIDGVPATRVSVTANSINVFPQSRLSGSHRVTVDGSISNQFGYSLGENVTFDASFGGIKPAVRFTGSGVIVPQRGEGLIFPFEAANLKSVDLRITKIFTNNIHYFLQDNNIDGSYDIDYFGRLLKSTRVDLVSEGRVIDYGRWNAFSVDLANYVEIEQGAIYRVEIGFRKSYSLYPCENDPETDSYFFPVEEEGKVYGSDYASVFWNRYYDWSNRDEPCSQAYFSPDRFISRNIFGSNLGIIAKGDATGRMNVIVTNLLSAAPEADVMVEAYDFQNQPLATVQTDRDGFAVFSAERPPFLLVARKGNDIGYLKTSDGSALSMSNFDVSGESSRTGTKGFIYGERGVWRPGDSVFVAFILEDKQALLPDGHPILFELYDPQGQMVKRITRSKTARVIYPFWFKTSDQDPTGNWNARVLVGGVDFYKRIRIETVKPNRLKINLQFDQEVLTGELSHSIDIEAKWLHGTPAGGMKAKIEATFRQTGTRFDGYDDYIFDAPFGEPWFPGMDVYESQLDSEGRGTAHFTFRPNDDVNEMLQATFITRVFEPGGDFSINRITKKVSPFRRYAGFSIPWSEPRYRRLNTEEEHTFPVATVDENGDPVDVTGVTVKVFKLDWRYWWSRSGENLASYNGRTYHKPVYTGTISTRAGKGSFSLNIPKEQWGRYLVLVNMPGGNVAGRVVYFDWPWGRRQSAGGAEVLGVTAEKESYIVGETVVVSFPAGANSSALVTLENGSSVIRQEWIRDISETTTWSFVADGRMAPNVYVHVSLINPHHETANDLPVRMYGIAPVAIEDPATHLSPQIKMPDKLRPESEYSVSVSEKDGRAMEYTLAIVDEGLLDLTNYTTPDPWENFYRREALGVKTWDMYRYVLGAYGGELERMFAIGGDEAGSDESKNKGRRFEPVVKVIGPFQLAKGKTATHKLTMPQYVGSVKAMVVAANGKAYGKAEKSVQVSNPVMVLATMPRVLSPNEKIKLPVSLFVMEEGLRKVKISVETDRLITCPGDAVVNMDIEKTGEFDLDFDLVAGAATGLSRVVVTASAGSESGRHEIFIEVSNPNPPETRAEMVKLEPGRSWEITVEPFGTPGTNFASIEVSGMLPMNLEKRLGYLMRYPHGCIEQTTSAVFPQIYLSRLMELDADQKTFINDAVATAIEKIRRFQLADGSMSFWPGINHTTPWGTVYATHFLVEAEKAGYGVPSALKSRLLKFLKGAVNSYRYDAGNYYGHATQAYALYVLALANDPATGAMNRLRERESIDMLARWYLAGAYSLSGRGEVASSLVDLRNISPGRSYPEIYGSASRDRAVILNVLTMMGRDEEAFKLARELSEELSSERWMSTQSTAWTLIALTGFIGDQPIGEPVLYNLAIDGKSEKYSSENIMTSHPVDISGGIRRVGVTNNGSRDIYLFMAQTGTPAGISSSTDSRGLELEVSYYDGNRKRIDPASVDQGADITVEVTVLNRTALRVRDLALTQVFPSGWEIMNTRLFEGANTNVNSSFDYQDIRDDRIYTYFDLSAGGKATFRVTVTAAYAGEYIMPGTVVEGMYDNSVYARTAGRRVSVNRQ